MNFGRNQENHLFHKLIRIHSTNDATNDLPIK